MRNVPTGESKAMWTALGGAFSIVLGTESRIRKSQVVSRIASAGLNVGERNKNDTVTAAFNQADEWQAKKLVEELLDLLVTEGLFVSGEETDEKSVKRLQDAFLACGAELDASGFLDWHEEVLKPSPPSFAAISTPPAGLSPGHRTLSARLTAAPSTPVAVDNQPRLSHSRSADEVTKVSVPTIIRVLQRVPEASRPLTYHRQQSTLKSPKVVLPVLDEYDAQDFVSNAFELFWDESVVQEQPSGITGGRSSLRGDFHFEAEKIMVEVKVAKIGHAEKEIQDEIAQDQARYRGKRDVEVLVVAIYDLEHALSKEGALKRHLESTKDIETHVVIVDWPKNPTTATRKSSNGAS
ncbi:hypothetical protein StoSoilA2_25990 [Arthrobacter sp. StoSoilA2]|nr:hypothetical protein StoSoilA2_25990 [Arthrobacter sp. StoSoilA2]